MITADSATPSPLPAAARGRIFLYLGVLIMLVEFGNPTGWLIQLPISFFLKNKLHLSAHQLADFLLVSAIPLYGSFLFGFVRDVWNPFGMRDRGFLVLFGAICAAVYTVFAFIPPSRVTMLIAVLMLTCAFRFAYAAQNGMTSALAQQNMMSGQISAIWNVFSFVPVLAANLAGGVLSDALEGQNAAFAARIIFLAGAALMAATAVYGLWKPRAVFDHLHAEGGPRAHPWQDMKRLFRHKPVYPALLIWSLWQFSPGSATPLQYYLQNTLHASDAQWGQWNAIYLGSFIPMFLLYGLLCRRYALGRLLFWGAVVAVPQMVPLLLVHNVTGALIAAAPIGLMGGLCSAAYTDLLIRSCPKGLQGSVLMMSWGLYWVSTRFGDVLGTRLYDHYGNFTVCVIAITVVYALIVPLLRLVPKGLVATADGGMAG